MLIILRSFLIVIFIVGVIEVANGKSVKHRNEVQCNCVSLLKCGASWRVGIEESEENPCTNPGEVCCSPPPDHGQAESYEETGSDNPAPDTYEQPEGETGQNGDYGKEDDHMQHPRCTCVSSLKCGATLKTQVEKDEEEEEPNICEIPGEVCCPNSIVGGNEPQEQPQFPEEHPQEYPEEHPDEHHTEELPESPDDNQGGNLGCGESHLFTNPDTYLDEKQHPANYGETPWAVLIYNNDQYHEHNDLREAVFCGGSIIQDQVILTAAHCLIGKDQATLTVRAGEWNILDSTNVPLPNQERKIQSYKVHQKYREGYTPYDIAIIIVDEPFQLALNVNPICLPSDYHDFDSENCIASGWGKLPGEESGITNILKRLPMPIVSRKQCRDRLRKTTLGSHFYLDKGFTCAGGVEGVDTCQGDGGGPLACASKETGGVMILAGVTSWGVGCGLGNPSVFTDVVAFKDWINEVLIEYGVQY